MIFPVFTQIINWPVKFHIGVFYAKEIQIIMLTALAFIADLIAFYALAGALYQKQSY